MIHSGSRGLGYQVCDDALVSLRNAPEKYGIALPDRQLACARSTARKVGIISVRCGPRPTSASAIASSSCIRHARCSAKCSADTTEDLGMELLYDVAHNIAKLEEHTVNGKKKRVWVHRKGATRAFPAGHPEVPEAFRAVGQPVIIPGDMGRASWILVGQPASLELTFGTTCHGAGRAMSSIGRDSRFEGTPHRPRTRSTRRDCPRSELEGSRGGTTGRLQECG